MRSAALSRSVHPPLYRSRRRGTRGLFIQTERNSHFATPDIGSILAGLHPRSGRISASTTYRPHILHTRAAENGSDLGSAIPIGVQAGFLNTRVSSNHAAVPNIRRSDSSGRSRRLWRQSGVAVAYAAMRRSPAKVFVPTVSSPARSRGSARMGPGVVTGDRYADALAASEH